MEQCEGQGIAECRRMADVAAFSKAELQWGRDVGVSAVDPAHFMVQKWEKQLEHVPGLARLRQASRSLCLLSVYFQLAAQPMVCSPS